ncbi:LysM peptidoglycan-binding domain-containing protein [Flavobacterium davisii]|uniref:LysM peptidoglycan-binding domain-containing protein n=1 Tax=Flavobacterium davisii TaxID=2906077 RepID=UPI0035CF08A5
MRFTWPTYSVKKGDTLESVAKELGIRVETLKWHHNNYCTYENLLNHDITHQKELIIPNDTEKEQTSINSNTLQKQKNVNFSSNNGLFYNPINTFCKYGIIITIKEEEEENEIKYETTVKWVQKFENCHIFEINPVGKPFVNQEEINNIADTLAYETAKVLYPMHLMVDEKGNWEQVAKCTVYPKRWKIIKNNILQNFEGNMVAEYFQEIENILENPERINTYMLDDYFLRTLFLGYCFEYGKEFQTEKKITFPILNNYTEPSYKVQATINPYLNESNFIHITYEGILHDPRTKNEFINEQHYSFIQNEEEEKASGHFFLKAFLDPNTAVPDSIYLECSISLNKTKKITVLISDISNKETPYVHKSSNLLVDENTTNNKKKGFWGNLF